MNKDFIISSKDEAYSYDELKVIYEILNQGKNSVLSQKYKKMASFLESDCKSKAIFFMPDQSFLIFSMLNGMQSLCKIETDDVKNIQNALKEDKTFPQTVISHLQKKTDTLFNFMNQGNTVNPVIIEDDGLTVLKI